MKTNVEVRAEAFNPDAYFSLYTLEISTAHTPFPWLGFNDAINEDSKLLQWNQAASEIMKGETNPYALGTITLHLFYSSG